MEKEILKFIRTRKEPQIDQIILRKNKTGISHSQIQPYYKATVTKTDRYTNHWHKIESPEIYPYIYGKLTFDKHAKFMAWGRLVSLTNGARTTGIPHAKD